MSPSPARIGFGGGCHWCTEAVFQALRGVDLVEQGFIASDEPDDAFSEAVIVHYDPAAIRLGTLIAIHLRTHSSTSDHVMRGKYRSAVYTFDDDQMADVRVMLRAAREEFDDPLQTRALKFMAFRPSDDRFQNYYRTRPEAPFCAAYIDPKLRMLKREFSAAAKTPI